MISDHGAARRRSSDPNSCFEVRTAGGRHYLMQAKSSGGVPSRIVALLSRARPISFTVCTRAHPPYECTLSLTLVLAHAHDGFNQMQTCGSVPCANTQPRRHLAKLWTGPKVLYRFASEHLVQSHPQWRPRFTPTLASTNPNFSPRLQLTPFITHHHPLTQFNLIFDFNHSTKKRANPPIAYEV